jgi:LDH2 family malate/lactate/ureidoglycolate dehydrogenase
VSAVTIAAAELRDWARRILEAAGTPPDAAALVAGSLVEANLRGVDSHGVQLLPFYIDQIEAGRVDPAARGRVAFENGACLIYDGGNGLGHVVSQICVTHAVRQGLRGCWQVTGCSGW